PEDVETTPKGTPKGTPLLRHLTDGVTFCSVALPSRGRRGGWNVRSCAGGRVSPDVPVRLRAANGATGGRAVADSAVPGTVRAGVPDAIPAAPVSVPDLPVPEP